MIKQNSYPPLHTHWTGKCILVRFALVFILIAMALTIMVYYRAGVAAREDMSHATLTATPGGWCCVFDDCPSLYTFVSLRPGLAAYSSSCRQEWRSRLFSTYLSTKLFEHVKNAAISNDERLVQFSKHHQQPYMPDQDRAGLLFERGFVSPLALWVTFWFGLSLVCWFFFPRYSILMILGTFAGFMYGFITPNPVFRMYSWDAPSLFFFTAIVVAATRRSWLGLFLAVCIGVGFKETALVGSFCYIFFPGTVKKRLSWFSTVLFCGITTKLLIDINVGNILGTTMTVKGGSEGWYFGHNLDILFFLKPRIFEHCSLAWNTPWLANAGTVLAFWFLPTMRDSWMWRTVSLVMLVGLLLCGLVDETRIFFELIPVSLIQLARYLESEFFNNIDGDRAL